MKNEKISIVLDKSFLQECQPNNLKEITKNNRLLVTPDLFFEISSSKELKSCFNKLLSVKDSVDLIEHLGTMYKFEIENQRSCTPLSQHFLQGVLNNNFNFQFTDEAKKRINDYGYDYEVVGPKEFEQIVLEINAKHLKPTKLKIEDAKNKQVVLEIYEKIKSESLPSSRKINEDWAIFRSLQVDLVATLEYLQNYKDGHFNFTEERKAHNQIDFRVCTFALLARGIASQDKLIKRYFKLLCPEGIVYSLNQTHNNRMLWKN